MELNNNQIKIIDDFLDKKQISYIDLKLEILDHIILDIEFEMERHKISFEKAFKKVSIKWKGSFLETSSFWLGLACVKPKIIISKLINILKPLVFKVFINTVLITIFLYIIDTIFFKMNLINYKEIILIVIYTFTAINILVLSYWAVLMYKSKMKTSFRFLYYSQVLMCSFLPLIITQSFLFKAGSINFISVGFIVLTIFMSLVGRELFKAHFNVLQAVNKVELL